MENTKEYDMQDIYNAVSMKYRKAGLTNSQFILRLIAIDAILNKGCTVGEEVGMIWALELMDTYAYEGDETIKKVKAKLRAELKAIVKSLQ